MNRHHWAFIAGALVLATIVGIVAYNMGLADNGGTEPGHYHHRWHGGPWIFIPFLFFAFWLFAWRGGRRCAYDRHHEHREQDHPDRR